MNFKSGINIALLKNGAWRKHFHRNYIYLTGIACAVISGRMLPGWWLAAGLLMGLTALLLCCKLYREMLMLILAAAAGWLAVALQAYNCPPFMSCYLDKAQITIADSGAVGQVWAAGDLRPKRINALYNGNKIQLYIPDKLADTGLYDGKAYTVSGNLYALEGAPEFLLADKSGKWQKADRRFRRSGYSDYLEIHGIRGVLALEQCSEVPESVPSRLAIWRRTLAQRLDRNIVKPLNRAVLGAVTLGLRHRLTGGEKKFYASVGLAHLFSISGLHVGVLAALVLLLMRPLPQWLHIPAAGTLICYVLTAGGNAPAVRAFVMVLLLIVFRAYFLRCRTLEVLSVICAAFLLVNPYYITDAGFLYSFVITAILIKSSELGRVIVQSFSGAETLIGNIPYRRRLFCQWRGRAAGAIFFAMIAAAGSMSLTLFFQSMFFAGSMFVNLAVLPILLPLYLLSIGKIALPVWADFWNVPLNWLVDYLQLAARIGNEFAGNTPIMHISYWCCILFVLLLMLLLTAAYHRAALIALGGLLLIIAFMVLRSGNAPQKVYAAVYGGRLKSPVTAVMLPQAHTMYLLNCGYDAVPLLLDIAAHYGITKVDRLDFGRPVAGNSDGLLYLQGNLPIHKYRKSALPVRSRVFKEYTGNIKLEPGAAVSSLSVSALKPEPELQWRYEPDGSYTLQCKEQKFNMLPSRYPRAYIVEQD